MTVNDFISTMKSNGAYFSPPMNTNQITFTNATLQQHHLAMLPHELIELYTKTGGITLNSACIFGPQEISKTNLYPIPSILNINLDIAALQKNMDKTIFGRNDLFYFAFDAFGKYYLLDNITLKPLRQYDNCFKALTDCLIIGKI